MNEFHCKDCGSNLIGGCCHKCSPSCDKCGKPLVYKNDGKHSWLTAAGNCGRYLPYRTEGDCIAHSKYMMCPDMCLGRNEVLVFDNGQKFGFEVNVWELIGV